MSSTSRTLKRLGVGSVGVCTLLATPYLGVVPALAATPSGPATVNIVSQTNGFGSTKSDGTNTNIKISATTTVPGASNAAVSGVRFYSQVGSATPVLIGNDTTAPYSIDWSPAAGSYTEIVEAYNGSTVIDTDQRAVVVDATSSSVHITSPAEGATIGRSPGSAGGTIVVSGTRSADLPALKVGAATRDNSDGTVSGSGGTVTVPAGVPAAPGEPVADNKWSAIVSVPACPAGAGAAGCNVVITASIPGSSDEVTEAGLYSQTLDGFTVTPPSPSKPVNAPQTYVVTATDQNNKPVAGHTVFVTDNSPTASETSSGTDVADSAGPPVVPSSTTGKTGPDGTFTFIGKNSAVETATYTVQSQANGASYVVGSDFQRQVTLTTYNATSTTPSFKVAPQKSLYAAQSEYTGSTGTPVVDLCFTDQNGQPIDSAAADQSKFIVTRTRTTKTGTTTTPGTPVPAVIAPDGDTTKSPGCYQVTFPGAGSEDEGSDTFNAYIENNGTPGYQAGSDVAAAPLTLNYGQLRITGTATQAVKGSTVTVPFTVATPDGTPFVGRKMEIYGFSGSANMPVAQPAGTNRTDALSAVCTTDAAGLCKVNVTDPAAEYTWVWLGDYINDDANKQLGTGVEGDSNIDFRNGSVALASMFRDNASTIRPDGSSGGPRPGDVRQYSYQLRDANAGGQNTTAPALANVSATLTVDNGFFTPKCTATDEYASCSFDPAAADGAKTGNLKSLGKSITVTSDDNGYVTFAVAIGRDVKFDVNGVVPVKVTAASTDGSATATLDSFTTKDIDVANGGTVALVPATAKDKVSGDVQNNGSNLIPGQSGFSSNTGTNFAVRVTDQFGNLVRLNNCDVDLEVTGGGYLNSPNNEGNTDCAYGSFTGANTESFHLDSDSVSTTGQSNTVTATWQAPVTVFKAITPAPANPAFTTAAGTPATVTKTATITVNLYAVDQKALKYALSSTPSTTVPVNTGVTTSVTVTDQKNNPVEGLCAHFLRSGPGNQSGEGGANDLFGNCTAQTNSAGKAGYSYSSTTPGTATITVIVTDTSGNELSRGVLNQRFTAGTPATSKPSFSLATHVISAGQTDRLVVRGTPGQTVEVLAYSLPNTTYRVVRTGTLSSAGTAVFYVAPATNSRIYARSTAGQAASQHITVKSSLTLAASAKGRVGTFTGKVSPAVVGRTVTIYYIKGGKSVAAGSAKVAKGGTYTFSRTFAAPGQKISFFAQTTKDSLNASGRSLTRQITFGR